METSEEERQATRKKCGLWFSVAALCIAGLSIFAYLMFFSNSNSERDCAASTNDPFQCPMQQTNDGEKVKPIRLICISDTHDKHEELTKQLTELHDPSKYNDFLIHAGDMTNDGPENRNDLKAVNEWFRALPFDRDHIIVIAGNNDKLDSSYKMYAALDWNEKQELFSNAHYLEDSSYKFAGIHFYGTPWTPPHSGLFQLGEVDHNGNQKLDPIKQAATWEKIPKDVNVLIVHGPPYAILDKTSQGKHAGDPVLAKEITKKEKLKAVVFGHIHAAWGKTKINGIQYVNAAQFNGISNPVTNSKVKPIVIKYL